MPTNEGGEGSLGSQCVRTTQKVTGVLMSDWTFDTDSETGNNHKLIDITLP